MTFLIVFSWIDHTSADWGPVVKLAGVTAPSEEHVWQMISTLYENPLRLIKVLTDAGLDEYGSLASSKDPLAEYGITVAEPLVVAGEVGRVDLRLEDAVAGLPTAEVK